MMLAFYEYTPYGAKLARKYSGKLRYDDRVDFYLNAVHHSIDYYSEYYDPSKCISINWFVRKFTQSILFRYMRYLRAKSRYCLLAECPLEVLQTDSQVNLTEAREENEKLRDTVYWLIQHARPSYKDVVLLHIDGKNFSQIAELTGLTSSGVQRLWDSFRIYAENELKVNPAPKDFRLKFNPENAFQGTGKSYWKECAWCGKREVKNFSMKYCPSCQHFFDHELTLLERRLIQRLRMIYGDRTTTSNLRSKNA